jgi:hypothetical protein
VIGTLKDAFAHGLLAKDEFDQGVGQAFAARTYAELAVVTASVPAEPPAAREPVVREPVVREPAPAGVQGKPVLRPGTVAMVATALCGGVWAFTFIPHWAVNSKNDPPHWLVALFFMTNLIYVFVMVVAVGFMIADWHEKRARASSRGRRLARSGSVRSP